MSYRKLSISLATGLFVAGCCFISTGRAQAALTLNTNTAASVFGISRTASPANCQNANCDGWLYKDDNSSPWVWSQNPTSSSAYCAQILDDAYCNQTTDQSNPAPIKNLFFSGSGNAYLTDGKYHMFESIGYWPGSGGCNGDTTWQECASEGNGVEEADFIISSASPFPSFSFLIPEDGSTSPDFASWVVDIENATSGLLEIDYSPSGNAFFNASDSELFAVGVSAIPAVVPKTILLAQLSTTTSWAAQANLWVNGTDYYSSIINFNILPSGSTYQPTYYQAFCSFTSSSFLADPVGNIQNAICNSFAYLFIPSPSQQVAVSSQFSGIKNAVATKPPFGYFTAIQGVLYNASSVPSSSLVIVNASTAAAFSSILSPLNNLFSVILWILFAFWLFHTMRNIKL